MSLRRSSVLLGIASKATRQYPFARSSPKDVQIAGIFRRTRPLYGGLRDPDGVERRRAA